MEHNSPMASNTADPSDLASVYKTVLLFLESQNLQKTYSTLVQEAIGFGITNVEECDPKILVLKPCKCDIFKFPYVSSAKSLQNGTYILETAMTNQQQQQEIGVAKESVLSRSQDVSRTTTTTDDEEPNKNVEDHASLSDVPKGETTDQSQEQFAAEDDDEISVKQESYKSKETIGSQELFERASYLDDNAEEPCNAQPSAVTKPLPRNVVEPAQPRRRSSVTIKEPKESATSGFKQADVEATICQYVELNYELIKSEFRNGTDPVLICQLLQALRWRLTRSPPVMKQIVMSQYAETDILDLIDEESLVLKMYHMPDLQYCIARFVNAVASLSIGRTYLMRHDCLVVDHLCDFLKKRSKQTQENDAVRDHVLATLQKLSLRRTVRERLIELEFVEYLIQFLEENYRSLSSYALEYTMALYMNLCLNHKTIDICRKMGPVVIALLINILNTRHEFCLPYITGSLYSLLADKHINDDAKNLHLENVLEEHVMTSAGVIRSQLEYILQVHRTNKTDPLPQMDEIDESQEVDHIEIELDACDEIYDVAGETLLKMYASGASRADVTNYKKRSATACKSGQLKDNVFEDIKNAVKSDRKNDFENAFANDSESEFENGLETDFETDLGTDLETDPEDDYNAGGVRTDIKSDPLNEQDESWSDGGSCGGDDTAACHGEARVSVTEAICLEPVEEECVVASSPKKKTGKKKKKPLERDNKKDNDCVGVSYIIYEPKLKWSHCKNTNSYNTQSTSTSFYPNKCMAAQQQQQYYHQQQHNRCEPPSPATHGPCTKSNNNWSCRRYHHRK